MSTEDYKKELLTILFIRKRMILAVTLVIFASSVFIAFFWPPTYASYGSVLVKVKKPAKNPEELERSQISYSAVTKEDLAAEVEILTSHDVIKKTLDHIKENKMALKGAEGFSPLKYLRNLMASVKKKLFSTASLPIDKEIYEIREDLHTEVVPFSNVIEVTYYHSDQRYAVAFLDALLHQYINYRMQIYYPEETTDFFAGQTEALSEQLEKKRLNWIDTVERNRIAEPAKEIESNLQVKKDLEAQLATIENAAIEKKFSIKYLDEALEKDGIQFFSFIDRLSIANLSGSLQKLYGEYSTLLRTYKPSSEKALPVEKQLMKDLAILRAEVQSYRDSLAIELEGLDRKILKTRSSIKSISDRNVELQKQNITSQKIAMEMELLKLSYETFSKRKEEAVHGSTGPTASYMSILSRAFPSNGPIFPRKHIVLPLGLVVGFITGCCFGFIQEHFDHTFKQISDVERYAGLPVIFSIGDMSEQPKKKTGLFGSPGRLKVATALVVALCMLLWGFTVSPPDTLQNLGEQVSGTVETTVAYVNDLLSRTPEGPPLIQYVDEQAGVMSRSADTLTSNGDAPEDAVAELLSTLCKRGTIFSSDCYGLKTRVPLPPETERPERSLPPADKEVWLANKMYERQM